MTPVHGKAQPAPLHRDPALDADGPGGPAQPKKTDAVGTAPPVAPVQPGVAHADGVDKAPAPVGTGAPAADAPALPKQATAARTREAPRSAEDAALKLSEATERLHALQAQRGPSEDPALEQHLHDAEADVQFYKKARAGFGFGTPVADATDRFATPDIKDKKLAGASKKMHEAADPGAAFCTAMGAPPPKSDDPRPLLERLTGSPEEASRLRADLDRYLACGEITPRLQQILDRSKSAPSGTGKADADAYADAVALTKAVFNVATHNAEKAEQDATQALRLAEGMPVSKRDPEAVEKKTKAVAAAKTKLEQARQQKASAYDAWMPTLAADKAYARSIGGEKTPKSAAEKGMDYSLKMLAHKDVQPLIAQYGITPEQLDAWKHTGAVPPGYDQMVADYMAGKNGKAYAALANLQAFADHAIKYRRENGLQSPDDAKAAAKTLHAEIGKVGNKHMADSNAFVDGAGRAAHKADAEVTKYTVELANAPDEKTKAAAQKKLDDARASADKWHKEYKAGADRMKKSYDAQITAAGGEAKAPQVLLKRAARADARAGAATGGLANREMRGAMDASGGDLNKVDPQRVDHAVTLASEAQADIADSKRRDPSWAGDVELIGLYEQGLEGAKGTFDANLRYRKGKAEAREAQAKKAWTPAQGPFTPPPRTVADAKADDAAQRAAAGATVELNTTYNADLRLSQQLFNAGKPPFETSEKYREHLKQLKDKSDAVKLEIANAVADARADLAKDTEYQAIVSKYQNEEKARAAEVEALDKQIEELKKKVHVGRKGAVEHVTGVLQTLNAELNPAADSNDETWKEIWKLEAIRDATAKGAGPEERDIQELNAKLRTATANKNVAQIASYTVQLEEAEKKRAEAVDRYRAEKREATAARPALPAGAQFAKGQGAALIEAYSGDASSAVDDVKLAALDQRITGGPIAREMDWKPTPIGTSGEVSLTATHDELREVMVGGRPGEAVNDRDWVEADVKYLAARKGLARKEYNRQMTLYDAAHMEDKFKPTQVSIDYGFVREDQEKWRQQQAKDRNYHAGQHDDEFVFINGYLETAVGLRNEPTDINPTIKPTMQDGRIYAMVGAALADADPIRTAYCFNAANKADVPPELQANYDAEVGEHAASAWNTTLQYDFKTKSARVGDVFQAVQTSIGKPGVPREIKREFDAFVHFFDDLGGVKKSQEEEVRAGEKYAASGAEVATNKEYDANVENGGIFMGLAHRASRAADGGDDAKHQKQLVRDATEQFIKDSDRVFSHFAELPLHQKWGYLAAMRSSRFNAEYSLRNSDIKMADVPPALAYDVMHGSHATRAMTTGRDYVSTKDAIAAAEQAKSKPGYLPSAAVPAQQLRDKAEAQYEKTMRYWDNGGRIGAMVFDEGVFVIMTLGLSAAVSGIKGAVTVARAGLAAEEMTHMGAVAMRLGRNARFIRAVQIADAGAGAVRSGGTWVKGVRGLGTVVKGTQSVYATGSRMVATGLRRGEQLAEAVKLGGVYRLGRSYAHMQMVNAGLAAVNKAAVKLAGKDSWLTHVTEGSVKFFGFYAGPVPGLNAIENAAWDMGGVVKDELLLRAIYKNDPAGYKRAVEVSGFAFEIVQCLHGNYKQKLGAKEQARSEAQALHDHLADKLPAGEHLPADFIQRYEAAAYKFYQREGGTPSASELSAFRDGIGKAFGADLSPRMQTVVDGYLRVQLTPHALQAAQLDRIDWSNPKELSQAELQKRMADAEARLVQMGLAKNPAEAAAMVHEQVNNAIMHAAGNVHAEPKAGATPEAQEQQRRNEAAAHEALKQYATWATETAFNRTTSSTHAEAAPESVRAATSTLLSDATAQAMRDHGGGEPSAKAQLVSKLEALYRDNGVADPHALAERIATDTLLDVASYSAKLRDGSGAMAETGSATTRAAQIEWAQRLGIDLDAATRSANTAYAREVGERYAGALTEHNGHATVISDAVAHSVGELIGKTPFDPALATQSLATLDKTLTDANVPRELIDQLIAAERTRHVQTLALERAGIAPTERIGDKGAAYVAAYRSALVDLGVPAADHGPLLTVAVREAIIEKAGADPQLAAALKQAKTPAELHAVLNDAAAALGLAGERAAKDGIDEFVFSRVVQAEQAKAMAEPAFMALSEGERDAALRERVETALAATLGSKERARDLVEHRGDASAVPERAPVAAAAPVDAAPPTPQAPTADAAQLASPAPAPASYKETGLGRDRFGFEQVTAQFSRDGDTLSASATMKNGTVLLRFPEGMTRAEQEHFIRTVLPEHGVTLRDVDAALKLIDAGTNPAVVNRELQAITQGVDAKVVKGALDAVARQRLEAAHELTPEVMAERAKQRAEDLERKAKGEIDNVPPEDKGPFDGACTELSEKMQTALADKGVFAGIVNFLPPGGGHRYLVIPGDPMRIVDPSIGQFFGGASAKLGKDSSQYEPFMGTYTELHARLTEAAKAKPSMLLDGPPADVLAKPEALQAWVSQHIKDNWGLAPRADGSIGFNEYCVPFKNQVAPPADYVHPLHQPGASAPHFKDAPTARREALIEQYTRGMSPAEREAFITAMGPAKKDAVYTDPKMPPVYPAADLDATLAALDAAHRQPGGPDGAFVLASNLYNLKGINAQLGATEANAHIAGINGAYFTALQDSVGPRGGQVKLFRGPGGNIVAVVTFKEGSGTPAEQRALIDAATDKAKAAVKGYVEREGLGELPNPNVTDKAREKEFAGAGWSVGVAHVEKGKGAKAAREEAQRQLEANEPKLPEAAKYSGPELREHPLGKDEVLHDPLQPTPPHGDVLPKEGRPLLDSEARRAAAHALAERQPGYDKAKVDAEFDALNKPDAMTGLHPAEERVPTMRRGLQKLQAVPGTKLLYGECDIGNLTAMSLENRLGVAAADGVFRKLNQIYTTEVATKVRELGGEVYFFRKGGDEICCIISFPPGTEGAKEKMQLAMVSAEASVKRWVETARIDTGNGRSVALREIVHLKKSGDKSKDGTGITFGLQEVKPGMSLDESFSTADLKIEKKKKMPTQLASREAIAERLGVPELNRADVAQDLLALHVAMAETNDPAAFKANPALKQQRLSELRAKEREVLLAHGADPKRVAEYYAKAEKVEDVSLREVHDASAAEAPGQTSPWGQGARPITYDAPSILNTGAAELNQRFPVRQGFWSRIRDRARAFVEGKRTLDPRQIIPSEPLDRSKSAGSIAHHMDKFRSGWDGKSEPIKVAEIAGKIFILDGHHRWRAALEMGLSKVPIEVVKLPHGEWTADNVLSEAYKLAHGDLTPAPTVRDTLPAPPPERDTIPAPPPSQHTAPMPQVAFDRTQPMVVAQAPTMHLPFEVQVRDTAASLNDPAISSSVQVARAAFERTLHSQRPLRIENLSSAKRDYRAALEPSITQALTGPPHNMERSRAEAVAKQVVDEHIESASLYFARETAMMLVPANQRTPQTLTPEHALKYYAAFEANLRTLGFSSEAIAQQVFAEQRAIVLGRSGAALSMLAPGNFAAARRILEANAREVGLDPQNVRRAADDFLYGKALERSLWESQQAMARGEPYTDRAYQVVFEAMRSSGMPEAEIGPFLKAKRLQNIQAALQQSLAERSLLPSQYRNALEEMQIHAAAETPIRITVREPSGAQRDIHHYRLLAVDLARGEAVVRSPDGKITTVNAANVRYESNGLSLSATPPVVETLFRQKLEALEANPQDAARWQQLIGRAAQKSPEHAELLRRMLALGESLDNIEIMATTSLKYSQAELAKAISPEITQDMRDTCAPSAFQFVRSLSDFNASLRFKHDHQARAHEQMVMLEQGGGGSISRSRNPDPAYSDNALGKNAWIPAREGGYAVNVEAAVRTLVGAGYGATHKFVGIANTNTAMVAPRVWEIANAGREIVLMVVQTDGAVRPVHVVGAGPQPFVPGAPLTLTLRDATGQLRQVPHTAIQDGPGGTKFNGQNILALGVPNNHDLPAMNRGMWLHDHPGFQDFMVKATGSTYHRQETPPAHSALTLASITATVLSGYPVMAVVTWPGATATAHGGVHQLAITSAREKHGKPGDFEFFVFDPTTNEGRWVDAKMFDPSGHNYHDGVTFRWAQEGGQWVKKPIHGQLTSMLIPTGHGPSENPALARTQPMDAVPPGELSAPRAEEAGYQAKELIPSLREQLGKLGGVDGVRLRAAAERYVGNLPAHHRAEAMDSVSGLISRGVPPAALTSALDVAYSLPQSPRLVLPTLVAFETMPLLKQALTDAGISESAVQILSRKGLSPEIREAAFTLLRRALVDVQGLKPEVGIEAKAKALVGAYAKLAESLCRQQKVAPDLELDKKIAKEVALAFRVDPRSLSTPAVLDHLLPRLRDPATMEQAARALAVATQVGGLPTLAGDVYRLAVQKRLVAHEPAPPSDAAMATMLKEAHAEVMARYPGAALHPAELSDPAKTVGGLRDAALTALKLDGGGESGAAFARMQPEFLALQRAHPQTAALVAELFTRHTAKHLQIGDFDALMNALQHVPQSDRTKLTETLAKLTDPKLRALAIHRFTEAMLGRHVDLSDGPPTGARALAEVSRYIAELRAAPKRLDGELVRISQEPLALARIDGDKPPSLFDLPKGRKDHFAGLLPDGLYDHDRFTVAARRFAADNLPELRGYLHRHGLAGAAELRRSVELLISGELHKLAWLRAYEAAQAKLPEAQRRPPSAEQLAKMPLADVDLSLYRWTLDHNGPQLVDAVMRGLSDLGAADEVATGTPGVRVLVPPSVNATDRARALKAIDEMFRAADPNGTLFRDPPQLVVLHPEGVTNVIDTGLGTNSAVGTHGSRLGIGATGATLTLAAPNDPGFGARNVVHETMHALSHVVKFKIAPGVDGPPPQRTLHEWTDAHLHDQQEAWKKQNPGKPVSEFAPSAYGTKDVQEYLSEAAAEHFGFGAKDGTTRKPMWERDPALYRQLCFLFGPPRDAQGAPRADAPAPAPIQDVPTIPSSALVNPAETSKRALEIDAQITAILAKKGVTPQDAEPALLARDLIAGGEPVTKLNQVVVVPSDRHAIGGEGKDTRLGDIDVQTRYLQIEVNVGNAKNKVDQVEKMLAGASNNPHNAVPVLYSTNVDPHTRAIVEGKGVFVFRTREDVVRFAANVRALRSNHAATLPADHPLQLLPLESPSNRHRFDAVADKSEPVESATERELKMAKLAFTPDDRGTIRKLMVTGLGDLLIAELAKCPTPAAKRELLDKLGQAQTRGEAHATLTTGSAPREQYAATQAKTTAANEVVASTAPPAPTAAKPAPQAKPRVGLRMPTSGPKL